MTQKSPNNEHAVNVARKCLIYSASPKNDVEKVFSKIWKKNFKPIIINSIKALNSTYFPDFERFQCRNFRANFVFGRVSIPFLCPVDMRKSETNTDTHRRKILASTLHQKTCNFISYRHSERCHTKYLRGFILAFPQLINIEATHE